MNKFLRWFDDFYFEKKKELEYTKREKIICYILFICFLVFIILAFINYQDGILNKWFLISCLFAIASFIIRYIVKNRSKAGKQNER